MKTKYNNDPYFTTARFNSICPETGKPIKKGDEIAYYPLTKKKLFVLNQNKQASYGNRNGISLGRCKTPIINKKASI